MSDSMSSTSSEPRMLERRVSNQRAELSNDQQMNYLLAWFTNWSDLQKEDFVPILAEKLSSKWAAVNGVTETLSHLNLSKSERPPSLFQCQVRHVAVSLDWPQLIMIIAVATLQRLGCCLVRWSEKLFYPPSEGHWLTIFRQIRTLPRVWEGQPWQGLLWARCSYRAGSQPSQRWVNETSGVQSRQEFNKR